MADIRNQPLAVTLRELRENGEPADPRSNISTPSLKQRFPRLSNVTTRDLTYESPHGAQRARVYRDHLAAPTGRALVWVHGGAFIGGSLEMPESNWVALELAADGIPVLAVDYTKCLGEVHYPVPSEDVSAAWAYAQRNAHELLGVDPAQMALGGASAGAALVAAVTAQLRDESHRQPAALILVYPVLHADPTRPQPKVDLNAPFVALSLNYAGTVQLLTDPRVFVGLESGTGFPPTLIVGCEKDALRPSGEAFASNLAAAGVDVDFRLEIGADHGHIDEPEDPTATATLTALKKWLRDL